ncbi:MAG: hypothetical protein V1494_04740 [Candidatus Diapherotrites archaeon]
MKGPKKNFRKRKTGKPPLIPKYNKPFLEKIVETINSFREHGQMSKEDALKFRNMAVESMKRSMRDPNFTFFVKGERGERAVVVNRNGRTQVLHP